MSENIDDEEIGKNYLTVWLQDILMTVQRVIRKKYYCLENFRDN